MPRSGPLLLLAAVANGLTSLTPAHHLRPIASRPLGAARMMEADDDEKLNAFQEYIRDKLSKPTLDLDGDGIITLEELNRADPLAIALETDLYKEMSRQTRRDVFDSTKWEQHRSSQRLFNNIKTLFQSRVIRALWREVFLVTSVAILVLAYNEGLVPYVAETQDLTLGLLHLPMQPWTLTGPFLSLLLVFRTNACYQRWAEARQVWGSVTNTVRDVARQLSWRAVDHDTAAIAINRLASFPWALQAHVGDRTVQEDVKSNLEQLLAPADLDFVMASTHKPLAILGLLTNSVDSLVAQPNQRVQADQGLSTLVADTGKCERIYKTPIPRVYTRHTERFLAVWLSTVPLGLYDVMPTHWTMVPATCVVAVFLFGIGELANVIEEPFSILPLAVMCTGIQGSIRETHSNAVKSNAMKAEMLPPAPTVQAPTLELTPAPDVPAVEPTPQPTPRKEKGLRFWK